VPRLCEFYPGICLTTEEKARKNLTNGTKNNLLEVFPRKRIGCMVDNIAPPCVEKYLRIVIFLLGNWRSTL
jgi:hypothetical protein